MTTIVADTGDIEAGAALVDLVPGCVSTSEGIQASGLAGLPRVIAD